MGDQVQVRMSVQGFPWSRELAEDEIWFADYAKEHLRGCTCKVLRRWESLSGTMFLCSNEEGGGLPKQIRATHPYGYRSGEWADVWGIARRGRDLYVVQFADGSTDLWVVDDPSAAYEFRADKLR